MLLQVSLDKFYLKKHFVASVPKPKNYHISSPDRPSVLNKISLSLAMALLTESSPQNNSKHIWYSELPMVESKEFSNH